MPRYMCVYFISNTPKEINKKYKRTKVIEALNGTQVLRKLVEEYDATYIKCVRDLRYHRYYIYDDKVNKIEEYNNFKLKDNG